MTNHISLREQFPRPASVNEINVHFEQQLDYVCRWLTFWQHEEVSEPSLHRDFLYSCSLDYPQHSFIPISTHRSRQVRQRLEERKLRSKEGGKVIYRMHSAMLRSMSDVKQLCHTSVEKNSNGKKISSITQLNSDSIPRIEKLKITRTAPARRNAATKIDNVARRHIQNEDGIFQLSQKWQRSLPNENKDSLGALMKQSKIRNQNQRETAIDWFKNVWSPSQRYEFLKQLIRILNAPLMYDLAGLLSVRLHRDFIAELPQKLSLKVLSFLDARELFIASMVSVKWQTMAENDQLWKLKCKESKIVDIPVRTTLTDSASAQALWKKIFQTNLTLRKNWEKGRCRVIEIPGHHNRVLCVRFNGRKMASGSLDRTIKIWNSSTGTLLQTLKGHERGVWAVRFYGRFLVSSSYDSTIRIWNMKSGQCIKTLFHDGPVWAIERKGDLLLSGSQDKTAKLWDIRRHRTLLKLSGHTAAVFAVDIDDSISIALTGSADRSIRLWNVINGDCHKIIWAGHASSVMAVNINLGYIASSSDAIITLWNAKTGEKFRQFNGHSRRIECLQLRMTDPDDEAGYIVSAGRDGFVKYWDIKEGTCIQTLRGHMDVVNSIHFDELRIASASYDHEIRIWDFNVDTEAKSVTPKD